MYWKTVDGKNEWMDRYYVFVMRLTITRVYQRLCSRCATPLAQRVSVTAALLVPPFIINGG